MDRLVLDIREAFHPITPGAVRIPLGIILLDDDVVKPGGSVAVVGQDARDAAFAVRLLRARGVDARPL